VQGKLLIAGVVIAWASSGCNSGCNGGYLFPLYRITVEDGVSRALICDANVTVSGAPARRSQLDCSYALEIPLNADVATVAASKDGYTPTAKDVTTAYDTDECGQAIERRVKLVLHPE
jgi:hypothetical protein